VQTPALKDAISRILMPFHANHLMENDGNCMEIADDVVRGVDEKWREQVSDLVPQNFCLEGEFGYPLDLALLKKYWDTWTFPFSEEDMLRVGWGEISHVFVEAEKYCYDAESPDGVSNFFEMPFIRRAAYSDLIEKDLVGEFTQKYPDYMARAAADYQLLVDFYESPQKVTSSISGPSPL